MMNPNISFQPSTENTCYVRFKNAHDHQILTVSPDMNNTVFQVFKQNPHSKVLWCDLEFLPAISNLKNLEFISIVDEAQQPKLPAKFSISHPALGFPADRIRITFEYTLDCLIKYSQVSHLQIAYLIEKMIWRNDMKIMEILGSSSLSVNWAHPNIDEVKAQTQTDFMITEKTAYIHFSSEFIPYKSEPYLSSTLENLQEAAKELSKIVDAVILSVEEAWQLLAIKQ